MFHTSFEIFWLFIMTTIGNHLQCIYAVALMKKHGKHWSWYVTFMRSTGSGKILEHIGMWTMLPQTKLRCVVSSHTAILALASHCNLKSRTWQQYSLVCLQAIHKLTDYLSYQVRLVARELIDAFDLPDLIIRAPIGMQSEAYAQYTQYVGS